MYKRLRKTPIILFVLLAFSSCINKENGVPFEKDGNFYIYAIVNDSIKGRFIFDTGASGLYLDSTFVERNGSIVKSGLDTARMRGAGATDYKQVLLVKDTVKITAGGHSHNFTDSPILNLTSMNGENIAGIVGNEFIEEKVLLIDNERLVLKIDTVISPEKYHTIISFKYIDGRIYFPVELNIEADKTVTANLLMDLGCADAVILNTPYFSSLKLQGFLPQRIVDYTVSCGGALGGSSNGGDFRVPSLKLGNSIIDNPIISFSKDTLGAFSNTGYDGLLGNEVLDRYNYAIDYSNRRLYLAENSKSGKLFKSSLTGFYAMKMNDVAIVMSIYHQSDAYRNGIRLGDTIVSINDKKMKDFSEQEIKAEMGEEGKQVKLTVLRNGKTRDILFCLKYLL